MASIASVINDQTVLTTQEYVAHYAELMRNGSIEANQYNDAARFLHMIEEFWEPNAPGVMNQFRVALGGENFATALAEDTPDNPTVDAYVVTLESDYDMTGFKEIFHLVETGFEGKLLLSSTVDAHDGNDTIHAGPRTLYFNGGDGIDTINYESVSEDINVFSGPSLTIVAFGVDRSPDELTETEIFFSGSGDDMLRLGSFLEVHGGGGNDAVVLGMENVWGSGGADDDTLRFAEATFPVDLQIDRVTRLEAGDEDGTFRLVSVLNGSGGSGLSDPLLVPDGMFDKIDTGVEGFETLALTEGDDFLIVADAATFYLDPLPDGTPDYGIVRIEGGAGNDMMEGGAAKDWFVGGSGSDRLYGDDVGETHDPFGPLDGEENLLDGGAGDDWVFGAAGGDMLFGGDGNDVIRGNAGEDEINGGDHRDFIEGGFHRDTIHGGDGDNIVYGLESATSPVAQNIAALFAQMDNGATTVINHFSIEAYLNAAPFWSNQTDLFGDETYGEGGSDILIGGIGGDTIDGGSGNDTIMSGGGDAMLTGGLGADTFVFSKVLGLDAEDYMDENGLIQPRTGPAVARVLDFETGTDEIFLPNAASGAPVAQLFGVISDVTSAFASSAGVNVWDLSLTTGVADLRYARDADTIYQRFVLEFSWSDWSDPMMPQLHMSGPLTVDVAGMKVLGGFEDTDVICAPFETATMIGYEPDYMVA